MLRQICHIKRTVYVQDIQLSIVNFKVYIGNK